MNPQSEKRCLQATVALLAAVPVLAGFEGVLTGPGFLRAQAPWPADLDSHLRFLSGVFVAVGIAWYSCIPDIEQKTERFRLLAALTFCGGLGRFASLMAAGPPTTGHRYGLVAELLIVPALVLWQTRIAKRANSLQ